MFNRLFLSLPPSRIITYLIVVIFLPTIIISYSYFKQRSAWGETKNTLSSVVSLAQKTEMREATNVCTREYYRKSDPKYIEKQLEAMSFLKEEKSAIEKIVRNSSFTGNEALEKRYAALIGEKNKLRFTEGKIETGDHLQETQEILAHAVEIDSRDLAVILDKIEGEQRNKPLLIITDFSLTRKKHSNDNEVFDLSLQLLKREFMEA